MSYNEEITTLSLARHCERSEAIQRISELDYKWIAMLTLAMTATRHCERSEAIQMCFQLDRHANARDDSYSSLRTEWSNPVSPARHCERSEAIQRISELDFKWIATLTLAMTATLKPSEISLLQGGISFKPSEISLLQGEVSFKPLEISLLQGGVSFKPLEISLLQGGVSFKPSEISLLQGGYPSRISHFHKKKHFLFLKQERKWRLL